MDSVSSLPAPVDLEDIPIAPNPMRETSRSLNLMYFMVTIAPGLSPSREGLLIRVMTMPPGATSALRTVRESRQYPISRPSP